jgi:hypothetical protein
MRNNNAIELGVDEVFVGIDWGASHHQLCAVSATGQRQRQVRLSRDVLRPRAWLAGRVARDGRSRVVVCPGRWPVPPLLPIAE